MKTPTYRIVRFYQNRGTVIRNLAAKAVNPKNPEPIRNDEVIMTGLTLEEAKEHCSDPETSSRTCTRPDLIEMTENYGPWFDGFIQE